ncbi:MAG: response regulator [candidate division Zixibacteria bacterium]|nr:response regulator [candidate division Zixibacteria bacterium]MBU1472138.1 response regulator [candidate division Zixibacteria bacterium]MBU2625667.1 response regulator [candidate division Zixibacteria bacterium]
MNRLLIVDDELLIRDLLYDHFSTLDYHISMADSGQRALDILGSETVDCILTDLKMPDIDGLELAKRAREITGKKTPVILMTGFPSLETAIEALRNRVYDYVVKPFNVKRLHTTVEEAIDEANRIQTAGSTDV